MSIQGLSASHLSVLNKKKWQLSALHNWVSVTLLPPSRIIPTASTMMHNWSLAAKSAPPINVAWRTAHVTPWTDFCSFGGQASLFNTCLNFFVVSRRKPSSNLACPGSKRHTTSIWSITRFIGAKSSSVLSHVWRLPWNSLNSQRSDTFRHRLTLVNSRLSLFPVWVITHTCPRMIITSV